MLETIAGVLSGENNFQNIVTFLGIYLFLLWLAFCMWVFVDSLKRFDNVALAILWFVVVLVLNFPALIFYLVIRPDKEDENVLVLKGGSNMSSEGGVNVPLINFIGEDGIAMSFQLKVNKSSINSNELANMKIDVGFEDNGSKSYEVAEKAVSVKIEDTDSKEINVEKSTELSETREKKSKRISFPKFGLKTVGKKAVRGFSKIKSKLKLPSKKSHSLEVEAVKVEESVTPKETETTTESVVETKSE